MVVRGDPEGPSPFPREPLGHHPADPVPTTPSGPRLQFPLPPALPSHGWNPRRPLRNPSLIVWDSGLREAGAHCPTDSRSAAPAPTYLPGPQPPPPRPQAKARCRALKVPCLLWLTSTTSKAHGRGRVGLLRLPSSRPHSQPQCPPQGRTAQAPQGCSALHAPHAHLHAHLCPALSCPG